MNKMKKRQTVMHYGKLAVMSIGNLEKLRDMLCRSWDVRCLSVFTARCYASAVCALVVCLSVCHTPVLYPNSKI